MYADIYKPMEFDISGHYTPGFFRISAVYTGVYWSGYTYFHAVVILQFAPCLDDNPRAGRERLMREAQ